MTSALFPSACQVFAGGRVLSLDSAQVSDTGRYTCVAVNAGGEQHRDYDLKVYGENMNSCCCIHVPIWYHMVNSMYSTFFFLNPLFVLVFFRKVSDIICSPQLRLTGGSKFAIGVNLCNSLC